ncbi:unnamed protein product [Cylicostephanus goldi]|uniref:UBZ4-type domain-containing protein n=1 Tax=Cylicostephanus goldi TaxID=71465 RepID=A0A3P7QTQ8_CYLGO|nr:unnamed protein product [Cylicostephanus goldi]
MPTPKKNVTPNSLERYFKTTSGSQGPSQVSRTSSQPAGRNSPESSKDDVKTAPTEIIDIELVAGPSWLLPSSSSSRLGSATCPIEIAEDLEPSHPSSTSQLTSGPTAALDEIDQVNLSKHVYCPSCGDRVIEFYINEHLDLCIAAQ